MFRNQEEEWSEHPLHTHVQAPPPWRYVSTLDRSGNQLADFSDSSHNVGLVQEADTAFSRSEINILRGQYLGYDIDVFDDPNYSDEFEIPGIDLDDPIPYDPETFNPVFDSGLSRVYEVYDNLSEASTIFQVDQPLDLSQFMTAIRRTEPPTYDEAVGSTMSPVNQQMPEPAAVADQSRLSSTGMDEKPQPSPYVKNRPGTKSSNQAQKTRTKKGRNGKGQTRKSKPNKRIQTSEKAQEPIAEPSPAASDMGAPEPVCPVSPVITGPQEVDTAGWTEVRRNNRRKKGALAQPAVTNTARVSGNEQQPETLPAATEPTVVIAPSSPVASCTGLPGVPKVASVEVITPKVTAATSAVSAVAETRRAEEAQLDTQNAPVREDDSPAPVQQEHTTPCIVDTERWRKRVLGLDAEEAARQAAEAEQEERRRWEASYARRQLEQGAQQPSSISHPSDLSEVVSPQIPIGSALVPSQSQQFTPGPGQPVVQQRALNVGRREECGYFTSCCAHIPFWNQPNMGYPPLGCCCNHAGVNCCLCRPPQRWGPLAPGVSLELVRPVVAATFPVSPFTENSARGPSFTGGFPIRQPQQPHLHWRPPVPAPPQAQNRPLPLPGVSPRFSLSLPLRRPFVPRPSPPVSRVPSQLVEQPAAAVTTMPAMSAAEKSPSVTSTVKDAPAPSLPVPAQHVAHRVTPVIPLWFLAPASSQSKVRAGKITRSAAEDGGDMSTKANEVAPQGELAPSVASLFEHARKTAAVPSPVIQVDPVTPESRHESPKESEHTQVVGTEGLTVDKLRISGAQVEPDLRSPSLYFDAKQQMSSSPAQSSESNRTPPKKSCLKTTPSTPSPPNASPPRSSVRFSDGTSPGNSPDTKIVDVSPDPIHPRVHSADSVSHGSNHGSNRSSEAKSAAGHVQSLWKDPAFADLQIVLIPYPGSEDPPKFQDNTPTTFRVHKSIVSASQFLRAAMEFKQSRDGHVAVLNVHAGPHFASAYAFEKALSVLYGMELVSTETLRHVTLESIGRSEDDLTGLHEDSLKIMQLAFAFSYASAGAFLARRDITARAFDLVVDLLTWQTVEYITAFGMTAYGWTLACRDVMTSPAGSPRSVGSEALAVGRIAESDFVHVWAEFVRTAAFRFFARNMLPDFKLYNRAQSNHAVSRIPEPIWTLPGSLLSNPLLENVRFGDMPSYADRRPSRLDILIISGMLISLPYGCFMNLVDILKSHSKLTVGLLKEVVERREERRLHALRVYHRRSWPPGAINQHALEELGYREYVSGEPGEVTREDAIAATTSVQRVSVGLSVPNMNIVASHPRQGPSVIMPGPSTPPEQQESTAAATQKTANKDIAEETSDRGRLRQRRKKTKKKKAKKTQAGTSDDPTEAQQGVQHG